MNYYIAGEPNLANCENKIGSPGISMQYFPLEESLRDKWTWFVRFHRNDFVPKKTSCLYSIHFEENCFENKPLIVTNADGQTTQLTRNLGKGSILTKDMVILFPTQVTRSIAPSNTSFLQAERFSRQHLYSKASERNSTADSPKSTSKMIKMIVQLSQPRWRVSQPAIEESRPRRRHDNRCIND